MYSKLCTTVNSYRCFRSVRKAHVPKHNQL